MADVISVSALNQYLKNLMDGDRFLTNVLVSGELSNYKVYPSGHHYFTLKDGEASLRCVLFRREAALLRFRPENGVQVVAGGRVTVFPRDGQLQLTCNRMMPLGLGDLHLAFQQIRAKLEAEGLFHPDHKKPIPRYPRRIALVTSPVGAAVRDMIRVLGARYPLTQVMVVPVRVQGAEAPLEICRALELVNRHGAADLIITGRGGGSMEDLWAFNEEAVARAIFASQVPVISAVGHEPDVTISDYVADLRAATPSNAAEMAVPDVRELGHRLSQLRGRMERGLHHRLKSEKSRLELAGKSPWLSGETPLFQERRQLLDFQESRLRSGLEKNLAAQKHRLGSLAASLDALSPLKVLGRGYALVKDENQKPLSSVETVSPGQGLGIQMKDGSLFCRVERKEVQHGSEKAKL